MSTVPSVVAVLVAALFGAAASGVLPLPALLFPPPQADSKVVNASTIATRNVAFFFSFMTDVPPKIVME
ncbi:hypothetical protein D3C73_1601220 [compost metagenome]